MYKVSKTLTFDAAHSLGKGYIGKCQNLHGHTYKVEFTVEAEELDRFDMVIDFGEIKKIWSDKLDKVLDHHFINEVRSPDGSIEVFGEKENTTAENISAYIFKIMSEEIRLLNLPNNPFLSSIKLWETPTSMAEFYVTKEKDPNLLRKIIDNATS